MSALGYDQNYEGTTYIALDRGPCGPKAAKAGVWSAWSAVHSNVRQTQGETNMTASTIELYKRIDAARVAALTGRDPKTMSILDLTGPS